MKKIAEVLEQDGILTGAGKTKWYDSTINKILRNEKYTGYSYYKIDRLYTYAKMLPFLLAWCVLYRPGFILFCTP